MDCQKIRLIFTRIIVLLIVCGVSVPTTLVVSQAIDDHVQKFITTELVGDSYLGIYVSDTDEQKKVQVALVDIDEVHPGFIDMLALSPDGDSLVYVTNSAAWDDARVWIARTDGGNSREIARLGSDLWIAPVVWSPDSQKLAYVLLRNDAAGEFSVEIWTMNADGSSQTRIVRDPSLSPELFIGNPSSVLSWTPDSSCIQYVNDLITPSRVYQIDVASADLRSWVTASTAEGDTSHSEASLLALPCSVTLFSQRDPVFQPDLLTASCLPPYNMTMAQGGCAITSLAMMLKYYGVATNPRILDDTLGTSRCPLSSHWAEVATVGGAGSDVSLVGAWDGAQWSMLQSDLAAGKPVVVFLYRASDGVSHYVLAIAGSGSSATGYTIADPWDGATKSMQSYYNTGYQFSGLIRYTGTPHCLQDRTAPTTSASLSGAVGENGWYRSSVQVTLSATDNTGGSGLKLIQYKIDDGTWHTYSGSFAVSGEGRHTVYYKAQDNAGNWEAEKQVAVKIDVTAPTGSLILAGGATSTPGVVVTISPSASDTTSGVGQMRLRDAGGTWSDWRSYATRLLWQLPATTGSTYSVEVQYKDTAGNISATYNDGISLNIYPNRPSSAGYRLARSTWGVAPWDRQSANYRLQGTAGQVSLVGRISSNNYGLISGFWLGTPPQLRVYLPLVLR